MVKKSPWCNNFQLNKVQLLIRENVSQKIVNQLVWAILRLSKSSPQRGKCQQPVEVLSKSVTFLNFRLSQGSVATLQVRWKSLGCIGAYIENKFSYKSTDERIVKSGPHLPKLLSKIKWLTFLGHSVFSSYGQATARGTDKRGRDVMRNMASYRLTNI